MGLDRWPNAGTNQPVVARIESRTVVQFGVPNRLARFETTIKLMTVVKYCGPGINYNIRAIVKLVKKTILIYSVAIALAAFSLQWLDYKYAVRSLSTEIYVVVIAVAFAALGVWIGIRLVSPDSGEPFRPNNQVIASLGLTPAEVKTLHLLAAGHSNAEIAHQSHVSVNTVKSHLSSAYSKLDATRRTQAVSKARLLRIIE